MIKKNIVEDIQITASKNSELQKNEKNRFEKVSTSAWIIKRLVRTWKAFENIGKLSFSWMIKEGIIWSLNQITI